MLRNLHFELSRLRGEFEAILVDASDNGVKSEKFSVIYSKKGRGIQLNAGAKEAKFNVLWFLHADSKISPSSINLIENALKSSKIGSFKLKFDKDSFWLNLIAFFSNLRVKFRNIAFGDQGIFITKELFYELGGFKDLPIMEDYEFSMRVKAKGVKFNQLNETITTSARRFKYPLKTALKMQILQYKFRQNYNIKEIDDEYKKV